MPVTKTAKRALRSSDRKKAVNDLLRTKLELAIRISKNKPDGKHISAAVSLVDKAVKLNLIHKNKAARIKSKLTKREKKDTPKKPRKTTRAKTAK